MTSESRPSVSESIEGSENSVNMESELDNRCIIIA